MRDIDPRHNPVLMVFPLTEAISFDVAQAYGRDVVTLDRVAALAHEFQRSRSVSGTATRPGPSPARHSLGNGRSAKSDLRRFGEDPVPEGPILAVRVADLAEKEAVLAANREAFFTIPHFDGFAPKAIRTA
jgi:hypothetical protein